eukprot:CAMPEP_0172355954 /NCGR_PEP_ID=MMETSP1060-20121228/317_1 /TAXON_ID=37318 /ORGANISM="Pseudo-nitzschia pungens, Strain cf. cingulata" /LENGTH=410 /DNA_ID=CAMNT_0013075825 /DNA_START=127 /DNA_END=1360 /DNA_ORIENTATION=+
MNTIDFQATTMRPNHLPMDSMISPSSKMNSLTPPPQNGQGDKGTNNHSGSPIRISNIGSSSSGDETNNMFTKFAFPFKLHSILGNVDKLGQEHIISWLPSGKAFKIHKPKMFAEVVMPKYFNQTKYRSFQRQLYIYGFDRIKDKVSDDYGAYHHELFVRGASDLCLDMQRQKIKGTGLSNEERRRRSKSKPKSSVQSNATPMTSTSAVVPYCVETDRCFGNSSSSNNNSNNNCNNNDNCNNNNNNCNKNSNSNLPIPSSRPLPLESFMTQPRNCASSSSSSSSSSSHANTILPRKVSLTSDWELHGNSAAAILKSAMQVHELACRQKQQQSLQSQLRASITNASNNNENILVGTMTNVNATNIHNYININNNNSNNNNSNSITTVAMAKMGDGAALDSFGEHEWAEEGAC